METKQNHIHSFSVIVITVLLAFSVVCIAGVYSLNEQVSSLQSKIANLQSSVETTIGTQDELFTTISNSEGVSLSDLYEAVKNSVVTIEGTVVEYRMPFGQRVTSEVQGSGFIYEYKDQLIIITNNHVVEDVTSITVTFADGETYNAEVIGADVFTDIALLSADAPAIEFQPIEIVSSSTLRVGDYVVAIGSPYGLSGTLTTGIVSALERTITVTGSIEGSYNMTDIIQTSTPINSGNSGGPLMTYDGQVIGITTAIVNKSDGLGFAVSSDTILRVIETLLG